MQIGLNPLDSRLFSPRSASIFRQSLGTKTSLRQEYNQPQFNFTASSRTCVYQSVCVCACFQSFCLSSLFLLCSVSHCNNFHLIKSLCLSKLCSVLHLFNPVQHVCLRYLLVKQSFAWLPTGVMSMTQDTWESCTGDSRERWIWIHPSIKSRVGTLHLSPSFSFHPSAWLSNDDNINLKKLHSKAHLLTFFHFFY